MQAKRISCLMTCCLRCVCAVCVSCAVFLGAEQALGEDTRKYVDIMQRVVNREETVVELELDDVLAVSGASFWFRSRLRV